MRQTVERLERQWRFARLGWSASGLGADPISRARLVLLGLVALMKDNSRYRTRPVVVRVRIAGHVRTVYLATRNDLDVLREIAIKREYALPDDIDPDLIVDLGAHIGLASVFLSLSRPAAQIVAVEADPALLAQLRRNIAGLPVEVLHGAIGQARGTVSFFCGRDTWGNSTNRTMASQVEIKVPSFTLRDVLGRQSVGGSVLLKIDVEGAEWDVLADGAPPEVDVVLGEYHARHGRPPEQLLAVLRRDMHVDVGRLDAERAVFVARRR